MATKSANVQVRVEPEVKHEAEAVLEQLGMPVSVVINSLYRQIIMTRSIPFSISIPYNLPTRDTMMKEEFDTMMKKGFDEAMVGKGFDLDKAFVKINESI